MHQHCDGKAAEGGAAQLFRQDHREERVLCCATVLLAIANPEKTELSHFAQHRARHHAGGFPLVAMRLYFFIDKAAHLLAKELVFFGENGRCLSGGCNHATTPALRER